MNDAEACKLARQLVRHFSAKESRRRLEAEKSRGLKAHFEAELRQLDAHASKDGSQRSWYRRRIADALLMLAKGDHESARAQLVDALDSEPPP